MRQRIQWFTGVDADHLTFEIYDADEIGNCYLSPADIGSFVLGVVEARCLDVRPSCDEFERVSFLLRFYF